MPRGNYDYNYFTARFTNFDYGSDGNLDHYNSVIVPEYNVTKVTAPAIVLYSKNDILVPPRVSKHSKRFLDKSLEHNSHK